MAIVQRLTVAIGTLALAVQYGSEEDVVLMRNVTTDGAPIERCPTCIGSTNCLTSHSSSLRSLHVNVRHTSVLCRLACSIRAYDNMNPAQP